ncbi:Knottin [Vigna unguiculata]|uniref:Knottin n=1 Tax=Vigna unguiculata TaxID=3917 RepID=A0A4D6L8T6_VIGUN|nr:Knottin [Vigna unguiculata]
MFFLHVVAAWVFDEGAMEELLVAEDVSVKRTEATLCTVPSKTFKYLCFSDTQCDSVCKTEGFDSGKCEGVLHRCMCTKNC